MEKGLDTPGPGALKGHSLNRWGCFFRIHVPEKAPALQREHPQRAFWLQIGLLFSCPGQQTDFTYLSWQQGHSHVLISWYQSAMPQIQVFLSPGQVWALSPGQVPLSPGAEESAACQEAEAWV